MKRELDSIPTCLLNHCGWQIDEASYAADQDDPRLWHPDMPGVSVRAADYDRHESPDWEDLQTLLQQVYDDAYAVGAATRQLELESATGGRMAEVDGAIKGLAASSLRGTPNPTASDREAATREIKQAVAAIPDGMEDGEPAGDPDDYDPSPSWAYSDDEWDPAR